MTANLIKSICRLQKRFHSSSGSVETSVIGAREIVGFGFNGQPNYLDRTECPMPAISFIPDTPDIKGSSNPQMTIQYLLTRI